MTQYHDWHLGIEIPDPEDFHTIGGFVTDQLKRIPEAGDRIVYEGLVITIQKAGKRNVESVVITLPEKREREM